MNYKAAVSSIFLILGSALTVSVNGQSENGLLWVEEETKKFETKVDALQDKKIPQFSLKDMPPVDAFNYLFERLEREHGLHFGVMIEEQKNPMTLKRRGLNHSKKITLDLDNSSADIIFGALINMTNWHWSYGDRGQLIIHAWSRPQLLEETKK